tara:strand:- start:11361 stop:12206 length:846 start_codon:yes stop_codon:yes gene_type:complete
MSHLVTAFISCSPRLSDNTDEGKSQIKRCIHSLVHDLKLTESPIYVIFDGVQGRFKVNKNDEHDFTEEHIENYKMKINTIKDDPEIKANERIKIIEFDDWLHQANSMKKVMNEYAKTPLVFSIQEDTILLNVSNINTEIIYNLLMNDNSVEYIKFFIHKDLTILPGQERHGRSVPGDYRPETLPATKHEKTDLLHKCMEWSDRPHFATLEHYNKRIWPCIRDTYKCTMEQAIKWAPIRSNTHWGTWIYGKRYDMQHEIDVSMLPDSKIVSSFNNERRQENN